MSILNYGFHYGVNLNVESNIYLELLSDNYINLRFAKYTVKCDLEHCIVVCIKYSNETHQRYVKVQNSCILWTAINDI